MSAQVLIVGAGPVGLTLAAELARYGVSVSVVDKAPARTDKSKALVIWSRTLELLDRGPGAARFIQGGSKLEAVTILTDDRPIARVSMASVDTPYPFGLMLPQSETERILESYLAEQLGVTVQRNVEVTRLTRQSDRVDAVLRRPGGDDEQISVDWLVGCDGAHSFVRHALGAQFTGVTMDKDWMLADVHMTGYLRPDSEASVYWHQDGVFIIFPISPGRYRVIADLPPSRQPEPLTPTLAQVQAMIDRRGPPD